MSKFSDIYGETSEGFEKETDEQLYEKTKEDIRNLLQHWYLITITTMLCAIPASTRSNSTTE